MGKLRLRRSGARGLGRLGCPSTTRHRPWDGVAAQGVSIVNPLAIKSFSQSELSRTKTDKADASLIARYRTTMKPSLWHPPSKTERTLRQLARRRMAWSGTSVSQSWLSRRGNVRLRKILYMPAIVAMRVNSGYGAFCRASASQGQEGQANHYSGHASPTRRRLRRAQVRTALRRRSSLEDPPRSTRLRGRPRLTFVTESSTARASRSAQDDAHGAAPRNPTIKM